VCSSDLNGYSLAVVDNLSAGRREFVNPKARFYLVDVLDESAVARVFESERPKFVCHHAALTSVRESMEEPARYAQTNVIGSLVILELCRKYRVEKMVYASTGGAVYGEPEYLPVDENHPVNPLDPYGASKHHVEHYLHLYRANHGLNFAILRYANVYGPRQDPFGEAGVVAIFVRQMLKGNAVVINGNGKQERDFVYVEDVAEANRLALCRNQDGIYNIGAGLGTPINDIFAKLSALTRYAREPVFGPAKSGEVFQIHLDVQKAKRDLGWEARVGLDEGLRRTVEWFRAWQQ
jgi:UDP-glucose 4-epimerase